MSHAEVAGLHVDKQLYALVRDEIAPGTGVDPEGFWASLAAIVQDLAPKNRQLLDRRDELQSQIDQWHQDHRDTAIEPQQYEQFLSEIGYLVPPGDDFEITTNNVDPEIGQIAGAQLVVPVDNARYALNAANARWGSLYDALYGTDAIAETEDAERSGPYNPRRGAKVIERTEAFLDQYVPLDGASYSEVTQFAVDDRDGRKQLAATLANGTSAALANGDHFVGYQLSEGELTGILLRHHGLHIEIQIDRSHPVGQQHPAGVKDVLLEAAVTTIQDCEDSVSAVDAEDKVLVYRNWLGIMRGTLRASFQKGGEAVHRQLNPDKMFTAPNGSTLTLPGRSLLLVRNVGIHMYTDAVTTAERQEIPEGFLDAMVTSLAAIHDLRRDGTGEFCNSRTGSVYIVKPKLHGPDEVAATVELFGRVEDALGLPRNTLKMGIMDEERRTTMNLKECVRKAKDRVVFINTGFLDRTGDEIHTIMRAGPIIPKPEIKQATWLLAYEDNNVDVGLETGFPGHAQIGKGMWTMPDLMAAMIDAKVSHPNAGATTAWVPSPTAAVLHAMHYHQVNVARRQAELRSRANAKRRDLLTPCLMGRRELSSEDIQTELDNNAQGILGYVVHWVDRGVGCSKVPDINEVGLMEDRATLRISSQHITNWLHHNIASKQQVIDTFRRMAEVVDRQNAGGSGYRALAPDFDNNVAFQAALALVFDGLAEPNGYTERVLTKHRRLAKRSS